MGMKNHSIESLLPDEPTVQVIKSLERVWGFFNSMRIAGRNRRPHDSSISSPPCPMRESSPTREMKPSLV